MKGIMVDEGVTSHIVNDIKTFQSFDDTFRPEIHSVALADGTHCSGMAQGRGTAMINLLDSDGRQHRAQPLDALYMPSYPHNIFSVSRATNGGTTVIFKQEESHMVTKDGNRFGIYEYEKLYYLPTVDNIDQCKVCHYVQT